MLELPQKLDYAELKDRFPYYSAPTWGEPDYSLPPPQCFTDLRGLEEQMHRVLCEVFEDFSLPASIVERFRVKRPLMDGNKGLVLILEKRQPLRNVEQTFFGLSTINGSESMASMILRREGNLFELLHRIIDPKFRGQGLASAVLRVCEEYVRLIATKETKQDIKMGASIGQLDVLVWLYNNGYRPDNPEDETIFLKILEGEGAGLFLRGKDYIYEGKPNGKDTDVKVCRLNLIKPILPGEAAAISGVRASTTTQAAALFGE